MIMKMTSSDGNQMFTSVYISWYKGVVFTFRKVYEQKVRNRIADVGSYLHFHFGDLVLMKYFTPDAAERAMHAPWNKNQQRTISTLDQDLDDILTDCDHINWLKKPEQHKSVNIDISTADTKNKQQPLFNHLPNDDKSLGTFGSTEVETVESTQSGQKRQSTPNNTETQTKRDQKVVTTS